MALGLPPIDQASWDDYQTQKFRENTDAQIASLATPTTPPTRDDWSRPSFQAPQPSDSLTNPIGSSVPQGPEIPAAAPAPSDFRTSTDAQIAELGITPSSPLPTSYRSGPEPVADNPVTPTSPVPTTFRAGPAPTAGAPGPSGPPDLVGMALNAAEQAGVDPALYATLIGKESSWNPRAQSPVGAKGLPQLMDGTARGLGVTDPFDPAQALPAGARYLKQQLDRFGGDVVKALAAYNAGPGAVEKYGGIPPYPETERYVDGILSQVAASQAVSTEQTTGQQGTWAPGPTEGLQRVGSDLVTQQGGRDISQFGDPQLTSDEAYAACGPAAAVRFAQRFGRNPTLKEALDLAKTVGWTPKNGMAGLGSEKALMDKIGVPTKLVSAVDEQGNPVDVWPIFAKEAQTGNPVTISTPGHYFTADGYNPESGAFHVGKSGLDLKGGSEWMTPAQMTGLMGAVQGGLLADNPQVPAPSIADQDTNPGGWLDRLGQTLSYGFSNARDALGNAGQAVTGAFGATAAKVQSPNSGNPVRDALGMSASALGTVAHEAAASTDPHANEQYPTGGPGAGPLVGGLRELAGYEQMGREGATQAERQLTALLDRRDRGEQGLDEQIAYWSQQYDRATKGDVYAAAQRNPSVGTLENMGGVAQGVAATAIAPSGTASGVGRAAASMAVDPGQAPFMGAQGAAELISRGIGRYLPAAERAAAASLATADDTSGITRPLVRGAVQGAVGGAAAEAQRGDTSPGGLALAGAEGAALGAARTTLLRNAPGAGRLLGRTARLISEEPGAGRVPLDEAAQINTYQEIGTRYEANAARIAELEQRLTDVADAGGSIVDRPPWAVGLTDAQVAAIARNHGVSAAAPAWWERVGLDAGSGEVRDALANLSHADVSGATSSSALERELIGLRAEQRALERDADLLANVSGTGQTVYRDSGNLAATAAEDLAPAIERGRALMEAPLPAPVAQGPEDVAALPHRWLGGQMSLPYRTRSEFDPAAMARRLSPEAPGPLQNSARTAVQIPEAVRTVDGKLDYAALAQARRTGLPELPSPPISRPRANDVDRFLAYTVSNMLSASTSFFTNAIGGLSETIKRPVVSAATAGVELLTGNVRGARAELGAGGADLVAIGHALGDALAEFGVTFTTGVRRSPAGKPDVHPEAFPGKAGMVATPALRGMAAFDEFVRTINTAGAEAAETVRLMRQHPDLSQAEVMAQFQKRIHDAGIAGASEAVYETGGTGVGKTFGRWRTQLTNPESTVGQRFGGLAANVLVPFSSIPDAILTRGIKRLPVVNELVTTPVQAIRAARRGDPTAAKRAVASGVLATATNAAIFSQVVEGNITGNGPSDYNKKQTLMNARDENGNPIWRPNSVRIGDHWVSYSSLGPVALQLGAIANSVEQWHEQGRKVSPNYVGAVTSALGETIAEAWYLQGITSLLTGIKNGTWPKYAERTILQVGDRLIPYGGLVNEVRGFTDPVMRDPRTWAEHYANRVPGASETVPARINQATGQPTTEPKDAASLFVRSSAAGVPEPVSRALANVNMGVPDAPKTLTVEGATLAITDDEQRRFDELAGPEIAKRVLAAQGGSSYASLPPEKKQERLRLAVTAGRNVAELKVWGSLSVPERAKRIAAYKAAQRAAALP
jgi:hypothetical protein